MSEVLKRRLRCAVYTRRSTDEGLDQEHYSIDAQRDAVHAYIVSQSLEGWIPVTDDYDDPAYSGGNMDRPALKRLLVDIEKGLIDVVVVYKIDRLTRSLTDFSRIIEVFERHGASFVSVTQQFNTTNSMGRLMLVTVSLRSAGAAAITLALILLPSLAMDGQRAAAPPGPYALTDLGTLGGLSAAAYDINEAGQVVGYSTTAASQGHAFRWQNGVMTDLGTFGGNAGGPKPR